MDRDGPAWRQWVDRPGTWWAVLGLELAALLAPLTVTEYPPLCDLINHMARVDILALHGTDPVLAQFYRPSWHVVPNLAMEGAGVALLQVVPVSVAARLLLALAILACLSGCIALHRARFRRRSYWPLAAGLVVYNAAFLMGFVNFVIGVGLALLAAAATEAAPARRTAIAAAAAIPLFFCHAFALAFFFVLLGAQLLGAIDWRVPRRADALRLLRDLILPALAPIGLFLLVPAAPPAGGVIWSSLHQRAMFAFSPMINYVPALDGVTLALVLCVLGYAAAHRAVRVPPATAIAGLALAVLFLALPFGAGGGFYLNLRVAICIGFLVFSGVDIGRTGARLAVPAGVLVGVAMLARLAVVGLVWHQSARDIADMRALGALLPPGSRVLVTEARDDPDPARWRSVYGVYATIIYLPALWVIERQAFIPLIFATPAQQPLAVADPYRLLSVPFGIPPDYRGLTDLAIRQGDLWDGKYLADWQRNFDFLVVLDSGRARHLDSLERPDLHRLASTDIAALYRILQP